MKTTKKNYKLWKNIVKELTEHLEETVPYRLDFRFGSEASKTDEEFQAKIVGYKHAVKELKRLGREV